MARALIEILCCNAGCTSKQGSACKTNDAVGADLLDRKCGVRAGRHTVMVEQRITGGTCRTGSRRGTYSAHYRTGIAGIVGNENVVSYWARRGRYAGVVKPDWVAGTRRAALTGC